MRFRLLKYCCRIWDDDLKGEPERHELRPIVPVVFYQGTRGWTYSTEFRRPVSRGRAPLAVASALHPRAAGPNGPGARKRSSATSRPASPQLLMMAAFGHRTHDALSLAAVLAASPESERRARQPGPVPHVPDDDNAGERRGRHVQGDDAESWHRHRREAHDVCAGTAGEGPGRRTDRRDMRQDEWRIRWKSWRASCGSGVTWDVIEARHRTDRGRLPGAQGAVVRL